MRIFIYEYVSANLSAPEELRPEGWAMLQAVMEDFAQIPDVQVETLLSTSPDKSFSHAFALNEPEEKERFFTIARNVDYVLAIAPETDRMLSKYARWVAEAPVTSLGCEVSGINHTWDKFTLAWFLKQNQIPTPTTHSLANVLGGQIELAYPLVLKPSDGAGAQETFFIEVPEQWHSLRLLRSPRDYVVQPYLKGIPASCSLLVGAEQCLTLMPTLQNLSCEDRQFHYHGGELPLDSGLQQRARQITERVADVIPGLRGYMGVDLILGEADDGSQDCVLEVNPRLTTSYVGLRELAEDNLAEKWLRLIQGKEVSDVRWRSEKIRFQPDGSVERS